MAQYENPVLTELDSIAQELEKTGNADLATLVDQASAEILDNAQRARTAAPKKPAAAKPAKKAAPASKKSVNPSARRAKVAAAMRKIARAQVSELEDIAAELIKEGDKKAALDVLKIAEELDSEYTYSSEGDHKAPQQKGDASEIYDRKKMNKPKMQAPAEEKDKLENPFEEGEGYPFGEGKKAAKTKKSADFDAKLDELLRLAMGDEEAPAAEEPAEEESEESDESFSEESEESEEPAEESEESGDDTDMDMADLGDEGEGGEEPAEDGGDMDLALPDLGEGEDELASMMSALDEDVEASDRMYGADEDMGDEMPEMGGEEPGAEEDPMAPGDDLGIPAEEEEEGLGEDLGDGEDAQAMDIMPNLSVKGPMGMGEVSIASADDRKKLAQLAKKLKDRGEDKLAHRLASLLKKK
jgi:hypothetical protein